MWLYHERDLLRELEDDKDALDNLVSMQCGES